MSARLLRQLPAVDQWLASPSGAELCAEFSRPEVVGVMREHLGRLRAELQRGATELPDLQSDAYRARLRSDLLAGRAASLRDCINATGIVVHTNLGRAPLAAEALAAIDQVGRGYSNLEYDLEAGERGSRQQHVEALLTRLTGAEAAIAVNNCAGALMLTLHAFANGREVVVSRGELIEIGGSFRMPDVIADSGARMVEVGTTNKTSIADYGQAIGEQTRILLASHPSNFRIVGFTAKPALTELAELAHRHRLLLVQDLGSGHLLELDAAGLKHEPTVAASLAAGVDIVTFSGDKLLGGPQAGIVAGRADLVERLRRSAMARALRIDKLSLAALEATLRLYLPPNDPCKQIPVLRMLTESAEAVGRRAATLVERLAGHAAIQASIEAGESFAGGGALPMSPIPTQAIRLTVNGMSAGELTARLRAAKPAVIARIADGAVYLDLRTVPDGQLPALAAAIESLVS